MTAIEIVSLINDGLFLFALIGLTAMVLGFLRLIVLHRRLRPAAMERETALLATELPADAELPHVLIQLPTFNEGPIVTRVLEAAAALDWPIPLKAASSSAPSDSGTAGTMIDAQVAEPRRMAS